MITLMRRILFVSGLYKGRIKAAFLFSLLHAMLAKAPIGLTFPALTAFSTGGKSTIASLLARFWDVGSGRILVRSRDVRDIPLSDLMNHIYMVFQRVYLFQDTNYNNISMDRPTASREEGRGDGQRGRRQRALHPGAISELCRGKTLLVIATGWAPSAASSPSGKTAKVGAGE